jgi:hypothetical protein
MAVGDSNDMLGRLKGLIPGGWFARTAPLRDAVFGGLADSLSSVYSLIQTVKDQTRIADAKGWFLDLAAWDFFGDDLLRKQNETDDNWRARFIAEIFRERLTVRGIEEALTDLTGREPVVNLPWVVGGGYGVGVLAYGGNNPNAGPVSGYGNYLGGYGVGSFAYFIPSGEDGSSPGAGSYGSLSYPYQIFVTAYRPPIGGIPNASGYGGYLGGYGVGAIEYADLSLVTSPIQDSDIYQAVADTVAAGITAWVAIED